MPTLAKATHALGRPGNNMRYAGRHLLLTARAPEGLGRAGATDLADEPFAVTVGLTAFDPAKGAVQIELGALTASAMGSGHLSSVGGTALTPRPGIAASEEVKAQGWLRVSRTGFDGDHQASEDKSWPHQGSIQKSCVSARSG